MRKNRLLKQSLAVLLSLSMSLGPCAPGSFAAFADVAGVSSEVETDTGEAGTDTGEARTDTEEEAGYQAEAEVSEEKTEVASGDSVSAGDSTGEETADEAGGEVPEDDGKDQDTSDQGASDSGSEETGAGKSDGEGEEAGGSGEGGGSTLEDYNDVAGDGEKVPGDEDDSEGGAGDEVTSSEEENKDGQASETDSENKGDASVPDQKEENNIPEEEDAASDTAATEAETETAVETEAAVETDDAAKNDETATEGVVKNSEDRHVLQAEVDETIISVIYDDGVFPENVTLEVRKVDEDSAEQEDIREKVEKKMREEQNVEDTDDPDKDEISSGETLLEEETSEADLSGVWFSAFEIRVLDENGEAVEPDTNHGKAYVRFEGLIGPERSEPENVRIFNLKDAGGKSLQELNIIEEDEADTAFGDMISAEGTVINDSISNDENDNKSFDGSNSFSGIIQISTCGYILIVMEDERINLKRVRLLEGNNTVVDSGYCGKDGDNLTWEITGTEGNYTLTINGEGEMEDYSNKTPVPWFDFQSELKTLILTGYITTVGASAFYGCSSLTNVTISNSVTSIGDWAFENCSSLTSITIPDSVTYIGRSAFSGCTSIADISLGSGVTTIGNGAFWNCSNLSSITLPSSVTSIGEIAFGLCSSLSSITLPSSVTKIDGVFSGCYSLSSITLPSSVTSIDRAFGNCISLSSITLPSGVTSMDDAFQNCSSLRSITIPDSVTSLHGAFYGCSSLSNITIPSSVTRIDGAFEGCTSLSSITIPDSVINLEHAFKDCTGLTNITLPGDLTSLYYTFEGCTSLSSITLPSTVTSIDGAFVGCSNLSSITIPNSVTEIGDHAFTDCSNLIHVALPDSIKRIGFAAFSSCGLTSITLPDSVTSIGGSAFSHCNNLADIKLTSSLTNIERMTFNGCSHLSSIIIPDSVTTIGEWAFSNCSSLSSITIPDSVTTIGVGAFCDCSSLSSITIPNSVTTIEGGGFQHCTSLTSVSLGSGVKTIESSMFLHCSALTSIAIPDSVTKISSNVFSGCTGLTNISLPDGLSSIGEYSFSSCSSLKYVYFSGTREQWNSVLIGRGNDELTNSSVTIHCIDDENPGTPWNQDSPKMMCSFTYSPEIVYEDTYNVTEFDFSISSARVPDLNASIYKNVSMTVELPKGLSFSGSDRNDKTRTENLGDISPGEVLQKIDYHVFIDDAYATSLYMINFIFTTESCSTPMISEQVVPVEVTFVPLPHYEDSPCDILYGWDKDNNKPYQIHFDHDLPYYVSNTDSTTYNPDLALMLMSLSSSSYSESNLRRALSEMGFEIPEQEKYFYYYNANDWTSEDIGSVAYAITKRKASDGTIIVPVIMRGSTGTFDWIQYVIGNVVTSSNIAFLLANTLIKKWYGRTIGLSKDWYGNFSFRNEEGPHYDFNRAAEKVYAALEDYLSELGDGKNVKIVITGHSRAAAVGNLLASMLNQAGYSKDSVYAYNFACPDSARERPSKWNPNGENDNIFNICNILIVI